MKPHRALIVIGHGSREAAANELLAQVAERVRLRRPGDSVEHAYMEIASPTLAEAVGACRARGAEEILVLPYLLAPGRHGAQTIPDQVREVSLRHPDLEFKIAEPLGDHEKLVDVLLERADALDGA